MASPLNPTFDPYFSQEEKDAKKGTSADEHVRLGLFPTETMIRVAGRTSMVLGAFVFVLFGIPVSGMLRHGNEPDGILLTEQWLRDRWVARMTTNLLLSVVGAVLGWGLARFQPWSRWAIMGLSAVAPVSMAAGVAVRNWKPELKELGDVLSLPCIVAFIFPASVATYWAACSSRVVFSPGYRVLVARTQDVAVRSQYGTVLGVGLALAMLIHFCTILFLILGVLVVCGIIRTV